jgi:hypothetical protein
MIPLIKRILFFGYYLTLILIYERLFVRKYTES